jgi:hypothetical protein
LPQKGLAPTKKFMKHLMMILLTALFCAVVSAQKQSSIKPANVYSHAGVTFASPDEEGWTLLRSGNLETIFEKRAKDEILNANVKTIKTKTFATEKDLLIGLEALKQDELSKLKMDSVHFNNTKFKGLPCVQYDGIFKSESGAFLSKFEYFNFKGYLCSHPQTKGLAVQVEFSNYSNLRGFSENLFSLSDEFFGKTAFSKAAK